MKYLGSRPATNRPSLVAPVLLGIYLGLAPVYWMPGVPTPGLRLLKGAVLAACLLYYWSLSATKKQVVFPRLLAGWFGFIALFASAAPGLFQSQPTELIARASDVVLVFAMLWTSYGILRNKAASVMTLSIATIVIGMFAAAVITFFVLGVDVRSPPQFGSRPATHSGFGGGRTGWSNALALYYPLAIGLVGLKIHEKGKRVLAGTLTSIVFIGSQVIVGGRAGLIGSLLALLLVGVMVFGRKLTAVFVVFIVMLGIYFQEFLLEHLRVRRLTSAGFDYGAVDHFSAGRLDSYVHALKLVRERPLLGHGFGEYEIPGFSGEIHNLWLRMAVESGITMPLILAAITAYVIRAIVKYHKSSRTKPDAIWSRALLASMLSGVVISMLEPNVILGTFQNTAIWWVVCGGVLAMRSQHFTSATAIPSNGGKLAGDPYKVALTPG